MFSTHYSEHRSVPASDHRGFIEEHYSESYTTDQYQTNRNEPVRLPMRDDSYNTGTMRQNSNEPRRIRTLEESFESSSEDSYADVPETSNLLQKTSSVKSAIKARVANRN